MTPDARTERSRVPSLLVRIGVAAGLTAYLFWRSDPSRVVDAAARANWGLILVAILLVVVDRTLMAYRWIALLCIVDPADRPPLWELLRVFFVSTFVGTFLPMSVGADAVRSYGVARLNVSGGDAVASVFMDRMLGVASLLLMALVGLLFARDLAENRTIIGALAVAGAVSLVTLLLVFSHRSAEAAARILESLPGSALRTFGRRVVESIRRYANYPHQLLSVLAGSVAVQVLRIVQAYFLGRALGIAAPLAIYFAFIPLILLVMLLPVTFNGIGTSQAAFVWFFGRAGVAAAPAFALSVLFVALGIVGNLPGGFLYVFRGSQEISRVTK